MKKLLIFLLVLSCSKEVPLVEIQGEVLGEAENKEWTSSTLGKLEYGFYYPIGTLEHFDIFYSKEDVLNKGEIVTVTGELITSGNETFFFQDSLVTQYLNIYRIINIKK